MPFSDLAEDEPGFDSYVNGSDELLIDNEPGFDSYVNGSDELFIDDVPTLGDDEYLTADSYPAPIDGDKEIPEQIASSQSKEVQKEINEVIHIIDEEVKEMKKEIARSKAHEHSKSSSDEIDPSSKRYDIILVKQSYYYYQYVRAIALVKDFVQTRGRLIYGGTAIDFALRAKGAELYKDKEIVSFPDLDFFSPDSAKDAYELAQILTNNGLSDISAIVAYHIQTMRVRFNMMSVADIAYMPSAVFHEVPHIEFDGYKVVHPWFQMISMHIGMSFPFINAPREVILDRKNKDFDRYDLLLSHYPISMDKLLFKHPKAAPEQRSYSFTTPRDTVISGVLNYAILYQMMLKNGLIKESKDLPHATIEGSDKITVKLEWEPPFTPIFSFVGAGKAPLAGRYNSYMDLLPESTRQSGSDHAIQIFYYEDERIHVSRIGHHLVTSTFLSMAMLLYYYFTTKEAIYMKYYLGLMELNKVAYAKLGVEKIKDISPFLIPMQFWPSEDTPSISHALQINLDMIVDYIHKNPRQVAIKPRPYYPANGGEVPTFDYNGSPYFALDGAASGNN
jgi:hypothetical protein